MKKQAHVTLLYVCVLILSSVVSLQSTSIFVSLNIDDDNQILNSFDMKPVLDNKVQTKIMDQLQGFNGGFLKNPNSWNDEIIYYANNPQMSVGFGRSELRFNIISKELESPESSNHGEQSAISTIITLSFPESNMITPEALEPTSSYSNYFLGSDPSKWSIRNYYYSKIVYRDIYEKIDLVYELKNGQLKYEFHVYPGGNPNDIKLQWSGPVNLEYCIDGVKISVEQTISNANFIADKTTENHLMMIDTSPICFQPDNFDESLSSEFRRISSNTYGFMIPNYNSEKLLIIDPVVLSYSTYVSGSRSDNGNDICIDRSGNVYVAGSTYSIDFPMVNPYYPIGDATYGDVFVFKLSSDGSTLLYSTYVGGWHVDQGNAIAVDDIGNVYVTGITTSNDFPTVNAVNSTGDGTHVFNDAFLFKLSSDGSTLHYSTYLSGNHHDYGNGIDVDNAGCAYVTGYTRSDNFPTVNAFNSTKWGGDSVSDAFVSKVASNGSTLLYSTFVGGSISDYGYGIAVDNDGNAYVSGYTGSDDFPTLNAYNSTSDGEPLKTDIFVFKLSPDGSNLLFSTYISSSTDDQTSAPITLDSVGNVYVTGVTDNTNFPTTENVYSNMNTGGDDVVVFKLSANGSSLLTSTYVGGTGFESSFDMTLDEEENVYVAGYTESGDFPVTDDALDRFHYGTDFDIFYFKLSSNFSILMYSSFLGGNGTDLVGGIAVDENYNLFISGGTKSTDFPTTAFAYNKTGDNSLSFHDVFVSKFAFCREPDSPNWVSGSVDSDNNQVSLQWGGPIFDGNSPVTVYRVYRSTTSGVYSSTPLIEVTEKNFVDTSVTIGTTYFYVITAVNYYGESAHSEEIIATPILQTIPSAPENLHATPGENYVNINWDVSSDDGGSTIIRYNVYRGTSPGSYEFLGVADDTSYNDTTAMGGTHYNYVVSAETAAGESDFSNEASATPTGTPNIYATTPSAPQNVDATAGENVVSLEWDAPAEDGGSSITSYHVYRGTTSGEYFLHGAATDTSFDDIAAVGGVGYYYVISAINDVGEGEMSDEVSATPQTPTSATGITTGTSLLPIGTDIIALGVGVLALVIALVACRKGKE
jgi:hypothetical protein